MHFFEEGVLFSSRCTCGSCLGFGITIPCVFGIRIYIPEILLLRQVTKINQSIPENPLVIMHEYSNITIDGNLVQQYSWYSEQRYSCDTVVNYE